LMIWWARRDSNPGPSCLKVTLGLIRQVVDNTVDNWFYSKSEGASGPLAVTDLRRSTRATSSRRSAVTNNVLSSEP
jgi:hypothetical protein